MDLLQMYFPIENGENCPLQSPFFLFTQVKASKTQSNLGPQEP